MAPEEVLVRGKPDIGRQHYYKGEPVYDKKGKGEPVP